MFQFLRCGCGAAGAVLCALIIGQPAEAHFQMIYAPEATVAEPTEINFKLVFTHPFTNGHTMDMGEPEAFFVVHRGERTDLADRLEPIVWKGASNNGKAFDASYRVKRNGDYVFVLAPEPYFEAAENQYIQQITKRLLNKGGIPTDWHEPVGLPTEIVPLNKPYNVYAGSTFSGVVLSEGEPVPGAAIEIEYVAAPPDMAANASPSATIVRPPASALVAIADGDGTFTFGLPRAGWWGFAALDVGPDTEHQGKPLSQDAVIWVHAIELEGGVDRVGGGAGDVVNQHPLGA